MKGLKVGTLSLLVVGSLFYANTAKAQLTSNLTVDVVGLQSREGNLCLKLFSGSQGFPNNNESAVQRVCVAIEESSSTSDESTSEPASEPTSEPASEAASESTPTSAAEETEETTPTTPEIPFSYTFENLPSGTYAVAIYHDNNGDEVLNRGAFGMPIEGYGFSNNAPATDGPPRFADAVVLVAGSSPAIQIQLRYPQ